MKVPKRQSNHEKPVSWVYLVSETSIEDDEDAYAHGTADHFTIAITDQFLCTII